MQPLRPASVSPRPLADVIGPAGASVVSGDPGTLVRGITQDSRAVVPGDLYLARAGGHAHGAAFVRDAVAAGAVAILTDQAGREASLAAGVPVAVVDDPRAVAGRVAGAVYADPARALQVFGVTGTNGKTTTSYLVEGGLRAAGHVTGLVGTIETRVADERVPSARTTPEATELHALFAVMRERGATAVSMEVSSHALALGRVDGVVFDVAGFTNLSQDHLDFHAGLEDYFRAKASLFTPGRSRAGIVNADDAYGRRLLADRAVPLTAYGISAGDGWRARDVRLGATASTFAILAPDGSAAPATVQLPGAFNVGNALLAVAMLATGGVPVETAIAGVGAVTGVPGRMQSVRAGQDFAAIVDYAHTPDAVETVLAAVRPMTPGRLIAVLGCGGDRDRGKRPLMGAALARGADVAVLTSDNPRSEDPAAILADMRAGALAAAGRARLVVEPDRAAAIALAVSMARAGDTLVVAGKGHEQGQDIGGVVTPFDDTAVLTAAITAAR
jgi:UDP-N-acetylmuramoyl-L-alanyl-D-glutamate--2,6-diaminopimelate ligase